jgi:lysophospholipase L1-like esterase
VPDVKTILCYGDSNTWGWVPGSNGWRFSRNERWPGVLRNELGGGYEVIEEGLSGRTTIWDSPFDPAKNGRTYLAPCLESHMPLDLVTILLGTNDLHAHFNLSAAEIAASAGVLVEIVRRYVPTVLLIAPPPIGKLDDFGTELLAGAEAKSRAFGARFKEVAADYACTFLDTGEVIVSSDLDGIHFDADEHAKLGKAVADAVRSILSTSG